MILALAFFALGSYLQHTTKEIASRANVRQPSLWLATEGDSTGKTVLEDFQAFDIF
jgi:hypothetical protein